MGSNMEEETLVCPNCSEEREVSKEKVEEWLAAFEGDVFPPDSFPVHSPCGLRFQRRPAAGEYCPTCNSPDVVIGSEAMCRDCGWAEDRRQ